MTSDASPRLRFLATISVRVGTPVDLGVTPEGTRRIVPILGGTVTGPELRGEVLNAGADYQLLVSDTLTEIHAKYAIRTEEGDYLSVENRGVRTGEAQDIQALHRGEHVDPRRIYFRSTPRISASGQKWAWLAQRILIASGVRLPDEVQLEVYVLE